MENEKQITVYHWPLNEYIFRLSNTNLILVAHQRCQNQQIY